MTCSFCGRAQKDCKRLVSGIVSGKTSYVCNLCIRVCQQLLKDPPRLGDSEIPKPKQIVERLNEHVVGQDYAKKILAVAVYNHYKRVVTKDPDLQKANILLLGPTGVGKTLCCQALAKILNVPFALIDATKLTQAGYVGEDIEQVIVKLWLQAEKNIEKTERGICLVDEVDKLAARGNAGGQRDVSGEGVQQGLLKMVESKKVQLSYGAAGTAGVVIDTTHILFIGAGAFVGLEDIVRRRIDTKRSIGFGAPAIAPPDKLLYEVTAEDLHRFGMIPEFVGRFPIRAALDPLNEATLVRILTEPRDAIMRQFRRLFQLEGCELEVCPEALQTIARMALNRRTGARGLRAVVEDLFLEPLFGLDSPSRFVVDAGLVVSKQPLPKKTRKAS